MGGQSSNEKADAMIRVFLAAVALMLAGCAAFDAPPPVPIEDGAVVTEPGGYTVHCIREPDSVFCP